MSFSYLLDFRDFLDAHGSMVAILASIFFGCLILLSLAAREMLSWLTRSKEMKKELKDINSRLDALQELVKTLSPKPQEPPATAESKAEEKWKFGKAEKQAQFPL